MVEDKTGGCEGYGVPYFLFYICFWSLFFSLSFSLLCYEMVRPRDPVFLLVQKEIEFAIGRNAGNLCCFKTDFIFGWSNKLEEWCWV